jgi:hypothetical protein
MALNRKSLIIVFIVAGISFGFNASFTVNSSLDQAPISPLIYGYNFASGEPENYTVIRAGGDRLTCYNWETGASNGGSYMGYVNDNNLIMGFPASQQVIPGIVLTKFQDNAVANHYYSIVSLQLGGYVAGDMLGGVSTHPPSNRWKESRIYKGSALSLTPNIADGFVSMDEMVNMLINKYGLSSTATGVKAYDMDNEPDIWSGTHGMMHPVGVTCAEILSKNKIAAGMIKSLDANAEVFGPVLSGFQGYYNLGNATDWNSVKGTNTWFISYYLQQMKAASDSAGKRLLDVLDLHWYPEAQDTVTNQRIVLNPLDDPSAASSRIARMQSLRTLWDARYYERSWISQYYHSYLPLLPKLQAAITANYPGTKLAFTEIDYGGGTDISGGIAIADMLGIFGKYGVYCSTLWASMDEYSAAAYRLYRNYDGAKSTFGNTRVKASTSDSVNSSIYASLQGNDLHIILINKKLTDGLTAAITLTAPIEYISGRAWAFKDGNSTITETAPITAITGGSFTVTVPALSVSHLVLKSSSGVRFGMLNQVNRGRIYLSYDARSHALQYALRPGEVADVVVSNAAGQRVGKVSGISGAGEVRLGADNAGSSEVYFATIATRGSVSKQKLVVIR